MRHTGRTLQTFCAVLAGLTVIASMSYAQSGTRSYPSAGSARRSGGSSNRAVTQSPLALEGYCPVSIVKMNQWVKGNQQHQAQYDGRLYRFADDNAVRIFRADAADYVPVLGGDCVVAMAKTAKRVPGNIRHAAYNNGRLYLFANQGAKQQFLSDPKMYTAVDLPLGGRCPVCLTNMKQDVPGKSEFTAHHQGMRYLFPSDALRREFLINPNEYVTTATNSATAGSGSSSRPAAGPGSSSR